MFWFVEDPGKPKPFRALHSVSSAIILGGGIYTTTTHLKMKFRLRVNEVTHESDDTFQGISLTERSIRSPSSVFNDVKSTSEIVVSKFMRLFTGQQRRKNILKAGQSFAHEGYLYANARRNSAVEGERTNAGSSHTPENAWVKFYVVLDGTCMYLYDSKKTYEERKGGGRGSSSDLGSAGGSVSLRQREILVSQETLDGQKFGFFLRNTSNEAENSQTTFFATESEVDRRAWVQKLATCILSTANL